MTADKPLLICMTPVRNEAWVLHAFLSITSLWADYIIIADQHSTDGSREIALSYPKVILIENLNQSFNEPERQKILIDRAREIEGDKILFGLDADEVFSANFMNTDDWRKILNSNPGDVFWFRWANISSNRQEFWSPNVYFPWMFHDDGIEPHGNYVTNMHSMRIPYPINEEHVFYVNDFKVMHLAYLLPLRQQAKSRFYKFIDYEMNHRNYISLSRTYQQNIILDSIQPLPSEWLYSTESFKFNMFQLISDNESILWFDQYIVDIIKKEGISEYTKIDIWDNSFLNSTNLKDPRSALIKVVHFYLRHTQKLSRSIFIRIIDKLLKVIDKLLVLIYVVNILSLEF